MYFLRDSSCPQSPYRESDMVLCIFVATCLEEA